MPVDTCLGKGYVALLLSLAGQLRHIIRGHGCHILSSYRPDTFPGRAVASYHKRTWMSYFKLISP